MMLDNHIDDLLPHPEATPHEDAHETSSQDDKGMLAENAQRHSELPLSAIQNVEQFTGLATLPAESCSNSLASSSSLNDSERNESSFVSVREGKQPATIAIPSQEGINELREPLDEDQKDDKVTTASSPAAQPSQKTETQAATTESVPVCQTKASQSTVTTDGTSGTSSSKFLASIFPRPQIVTPKSPRQSTPQQFTSGQSTPPPSATTSTLHFHPVNPSAVFQQPGAIPPPRKKLAITPGETSESPVSKTESATRESHTQDMPSRDAERHSAPSNSGSVNLQSQHIASTSTSTPAVAPTQSSAVALTQSPEMPVSNEELHKWIYEKYFEIGFTRAGSRGFGFIGSRPLQQKLFELKPNVNRDRILQAYQMLWRNVVHRYGLPLPDTVARQNIAFRQQRQSAQRLVPAPEVPPTSTTASRSSAPTPSQPPVSSSYTSRSTVARPPVTQATASHVPTIRSVLPPPATRDQSQSTVSSGTGQSTIPNSSINVQAQNFTRVAPNFAGFSKLLKNGQNDAGGKVSEDERAIKQGPLLSGAIVDMHWNDLVPQYGHLGHLVGQDLDSTASHILSNPNTPFSAFICGVQGSGKSHTTACLIENSIISLPESKSMIGNLQESVSCLVYSWADNSGSTSFNVSEVAYLGTSKQGFPDHHAKKVTVLYSPSNPVMRKHYEGLENVKAIPFYLNPRKLTINAMLTLMVVDESSRTPLYLATVEAILRSMQASNPHDSTLDYAAFKSNIKKANFTPDQRRPLDARLNILDSFLDLKGDAVEPTYAPGEVTIMDLSDGTLSSSTACALFKLGMDDYLRSSAKGKMVVLDEAHKYMRDTPGAHFFTDGLTRAIREMRHEGLRVVISTQEPTVANELIALCSMTIVHRFTSPTWFSALKKHIGVMDDDKEVMRRVEELNTGEALVYAPSAVLNKNDDGSLVKATGQFLQIKDRPRVTQDGGESKMAS